MEKNIVLIGFMGVGKSTIGRTLAEKLAKSYVDLDEEIEKDFDLPVTQIFQTFGERIFRDHERKLIQKVVQKGGQVVSLGGGAFVQEDIRDLCLATGLVVYLHMPWESWTERLDLIMESRPVLHNKSLEDIKELFEERQQLYKHHHMVIDVANQDVDTIVNNILGELNKHA
ncbi:shikimate kinase [Bacillus sp. HMF5848]|uniref:shikimate kinase n=1 Tax=Bacillus sp. HMF5848 TaxID=2495421 RepID=UPI000F785E89|nr:shikimate kinase [Bacillus sp. HMF5848]RSK25959.1 shikimate kinase [Bacillus sp. HMF5848]